MSNTYTWVISQLDCYPTQDNKTDVVFTVHWRRQATDEFGHNADMYGSQTVALDPAAPFTPYADLTEAQVISWLETAFGPEQLAAQIVDLDQQIANQVTPPIVSPRCLGPDEFGAGGRPLGPRQFSTGRTTLEKVMFTIEELNKLLQLLDFATKTGGLQVASEALPLAIKIQEINKGLIDDKAEEA